MRLLSLPDSSIRADFFLAEDGDTFDHGDPYSYPHHRTVTGSGPVSLRSIRLARHNNTTSAIDEIRVIGTVKSS